MNNIQLPSERHLRFFRRQWLLYLLGCTAMAVGTIVAVLMPGVQPELIMIPMFSAFGLMVAIHLIERARHRAEYKQEMLRILQDEWTHYGLKRSQGIALLSVIFAQVPLACFMAYVPTEPSVVGMACMTVALGCGVLAAGILYYTRVTSDE